VNGPVVATFHVPLPNDEGVYQLHVAVSIPAGFRSHFFPLGSTKPAAERTFQVVVLAANRAAVAADSHWQTVLDIDPASPRWWERLPDWTQVRRIPGLSQRPLGSTRANPVVSPLGNLVELPATKAGTEPNWQAYPLPVEAEGTPHMLEVDYPNDEEQQLGISILEPNAAGKLVPISRDSGAYVEGLGHAEAVELHKHRLVFWPRTNAPLLLVTNLHPTAPARFGHIRVLKRVGESIAAQPPQVPGSTERLIAAYLSRPMVPETFGASEGLDTSTGQSQSVQDAKTFYESATRLADYLSFAGYNAAAVSVLADGSATFRGAKLAATPMHDTELMVAGTTDLPTVDPLELMCRVFDRNQLALIPTLQFAAPLSELETERHNSGPRRDGMELIGPSGASWTEAHTVDHGIAPYYNPLDERVQNAILNVVRELVGRYGEHPSFSGVAIQLSGSGYTILPGLEWGLDDATVGRFERDTGLKLPDGPANFAARQTFLTVDHGDQWRAWRAAQLTNFYQRMAAVVQAGDPKRRLLLTTEEMFSTPESAARMQPNLLSKLRLDRAMLDMGIDREGLDHQGIVLLPTRYVGPTSPLADRAIDSEVNDALGEEAALAPGAAGVMLYHRPLRQRLASFDAKSGLEAYTSLVTQSSGDEAAARKPIVQALRNSSPTVFLVGGELLPLGQEDATRPIWRSLSQLPEIPTGNTADSLTDGCLTVRCYPDPRGTACLLINECPWRADATIGLQLPAAAQMQTAVLDATDSAIAPRSFESGSQTWSLPLGPYEVQAVRFNTVGVRVESVHATISPAGQQELQARLSDLLNRDLTAAHVFSGPANPNFESLSGGATTGWQLVAGGGQCTIALDAANPKEGKTSLHIQNRAAGQVVVQSEPFNTPATGQLAMTAYLRGENLTPNAELRIVFEADRAGRPCRRYAAVGGPRPNAEQLPNKWKQIALGVNDLPLDSQGKMRIKFELTGGGEVWIDQLQLYDVPFSLSFYERSESERLELVKLRRDVESAHDNNQIADCVQLLDGYWAQFLLAYTPPVQPAVAARPTAPATTAKPVDGQSENSTPPQKSDDSQSMGWLKQYVPNVWRR
jgi:hypothetical protein